MRVLRVGRTSEGMHLPSWLDPPLFRGPAIRRVATTAAPRDEKTDGIEAVAPANSAAGGSHSRTTRRRRAPPRPRRAGWPRRVSQRARAGPRTMSPRRRTLAARRPMPARSAGPRQGRRLNGRSSRPDAVERQLGGQRQADGADRYRDRRPSGQATAGQLEGHAGHGLGLRPRDQHTAIDPQVEVPKAPPAGHVLRSVRRRHDGQHGVEMGDPAVRRRLVGASSRSAPWRPRRAKSRPADPTT